MARRLNTGFTHDDLEDEVLFTRAGLTADPDAADKLTVTDPWMGLVDASRAAERAARAAQQEAAALRAVANRRMDAACRAFGRDLAAAVQNDRESARWRSFFRTTVDDFISQPLAAQAAACLAWLPQTEPAFAPHRDNIERWARLAQTAIERTNASAQVRGAAMVAKERATEDLTRSRDALEGSLQQRAAERQLPREWASTFFIQESKRSNKPKKPTEGES